MTAEPGGLASALPKTDLIEYKTGSPYIDEVAVGGWELDEDGALTIPLRASVNNDR